jgi:hypothetical protein
MFFSRFIKSAATLALLVVGFAAPVHAQINKQIISGTWYEDRAVASISSSTTLILTFTQTPANQFLNVTNVACHVQVNSTQVVIEMSLNAGSTSGASDLNRTYAILGAATPQTINNSSFYSIVQNGIFFKFGPGRFPSIEIDTQSTGGNTFSFANCTIVGNLTEN